MAPPIQRRIIMRYDSVYITNPTWIWLRWDRDDVSRRFERLNGYVRNSRGTLGLSKFFPMHEEDLSEMMFNIMSRSSWYRAYLPGIGSGVLVTEGAPSLPATKMVLGEYVVMEPLIDILPWIEGY